MPTPQNTDRYIWIDLETFGLVPADSPIIEIGAVITDQGLHVIDDFQTEVWDTPDYDQIYDTLSEDNFVRKMHNESGLWADCLEAGLSQKEARERFHDWLSGHGINRGDPLCGSSVQFDRDMLRFWMPNIEEKFSYRNLDISSIKEACARTNPQLYDRLEANVQPKKRHRVLSDIEDTINEYRFYVREFLLYDEFVLDPVGKQ